MSKLLPFIFAALTLPVLAAEKKTQQVSIQKFSDNSFDLGVENLAAGFTGNSCKAVASRVAAAKPEKTEFESTDAHMERLSAMQSIPVGKNIKLSDVLSFAVSPQKIVAKYDADTQNLLLTARADTIYRPEIPAISVGMFYGDIVDRVRLKDRQYLASNKLGAQIVVNEVEHDVCVVAFSNMPRDIRDAPFSGDIDLSLKISPADAMRIRGKIGALYVGNLDKPYWSKYSASTAPTFSSPTRSVVNGDALLMRLRQVLFYEVETGRIIGKVDRT